MWVGVYHLIMRYGLKFSLLQTCKWFFIIDCSDFQDISCTYCIPTLITVFIFFQPLKMNWPISLMLVCLMRETGKKKKGVQVNLSSHLRFQLKHATPFHWKGDISLLVTLVSFRVLKQLPVNSLSVMYFEEWT